MTVDGDSIIVEMMSEMRVSPKEIPDRTRRQGVRGYARCKCEKCKNSWSSHNSHIVIDLKAQKVVKIYKQKCKRCWRKNVPDFQEGEFERLVENAIEQEKYFRNPTSGGPPSNRGGRRGKPGRPPHPQILCEKCDYGKGEPCWEK